MLLITGSSGFVASHLKEELKQRNIDFIDYDIKKGQDIRNKFQLEEIFLKEQITEVIHLAARAGVRMSKEFPEEYISTNILGTQNIVDLCNKYKINKLIFYSSSSVFGGKNILPSIEEDKKEPISLYGITKLTGEYIIKNAECPTVIIRPFNIYGENGRKDAVIYKWLEQIKNNLPITVYDLESYRGYVYVKDLINATVNLIEKKLALEHEDFNLGGSEIIYLKDILNIFQKYYPNLKINKQDRHKEDIFGQTANIDKAKTILNFNPQPHFIQNLENIINNFKHNA